MEDKILTLEGFIFDIPCITRYNHYDKKLKSILLLLIALTFTSCDGTIGYYFYTRKIDNGGRIYRDNADADDDTIRFFVDENRWLMLMKAEVNGVEDTVLYDSGAGTPVTQIYTEENKPEGMKFFRVPISGADKKKKVKTTKIPVSIKTPMCIVEHFGDAMLLPASHSCDKEASIDDYTIIGFLGLDFGNYTIDFTKNQIYSLPYKLQIDTTEYIPVKCKDDRNVIFIYPVINGIEYECIFDTGSGNGILIKDPQRVANRKDSDYLYQGSLAKSVHGVMEMQNFVAAPENTIEFAGTKNTVGVVYLESNLERNNVGLQYIKKFDWIIEHKIDTVTQELSHKMYARPHISSDTSRQSIPRYGISTHDGNLKILTRLIDGKEVFKVGDIITSVNGEKITEENICHYYDLLKDNQDWSEFEIEVR